jgi:hypothetical protein
MLAFMKTLGTCLCGTLRYEVEGPFDNMMNCHCSMCRKHHGAAYATFVAAPLATFRWLGGADNIAAYQSSDQGERQYCRSCGSIAPMLVESMERAIIPAGNLQGDLGTRPQCHMFVGSKAPWYEITDQLPQYDGFPDGIDASGVERAPRGKPGVTSGSCLCGAVTYQANGTPMRFVHCHCSRCRRGRSAAHGSNLVYALADFQLSSGKLIEFKVPDAQFCTVAFCSACGGAAPKISEPRGIAIVPAGTLDADPGARPTQHIFVGSKASWHDIADAIPQFETVPST